MVKFGRCGFISSTISSSQANMNTLIQQKIICSTHCSLQIRVVQQQHSSHGESAQDLTFKREKIGIYPKQILSSAVEYYSPPIQLFKVSSFCIEGRWTHIKGKSSIREVCPLPESIQQRMAKRYLKFFN